MVLMSWSHLYPEKLLMMQTPIKIVPFVLLYYISHVFMVNWVFKISHLQLPKSPVCLIAHTSMLHINILKIQAEWKALPYAYGTSNATVTLGIFSGAVNLWAPCGWIQAHLSAITFWAALCFTLSDHQWVVTQYSKDDFPHEDSLLSISLQTRRLGFSCLYLSLRPHRHFHDSGVRLPGRNLHPIPLSLRALQKLRN